MKYYILSLNNNYHYPNGECDFLENGLSYHYGLSSELDGVRLETHEQVIHEGIFKKEKKLVSKYLMPVKVIGEYINGTICDIVTGKVIVESTETSLTNTGFPQKVRESNHNSPKLSYYDKKEIPCTKVASILKSLSVEDIERYAERINEVEKASAINYEQMLEEQKQLTIEEQEAEIFVKDFKQRYRK